MAGSSSIRRATSEALLSGSLTTSWRRTATSGRVGKSSADSNICNSSWVLRWTMVSVLSGDICVMVQSFPHFWMSAKYWGFGKVHLYAKQYRFLYRLVNGICQVVMAWNIWLIAENRLCRVVKGGEQVCCWFGLLFRWFVEIVIGLSCFAVNGYGITVVIEIIVLWALKPDVFVI